MINLCEIYLIILIIRESLICVNLKENDDTKNLYISHGFFILMEISMIFHGDVSHELLLDSNISN